MQLKLNKPLIVFDIESTGINVSKDRIVELGVRKINVDGTEEKHRFLINPTIPIPVEVSMIHGIYDKDIADKPTFKDLANELFELFNPCDLAGFNSNKFDVPMLMEEFLRCDIYFSPDERNLIDVRNIFVMMEKRSLTAAYKFYCDKELVNAHTAMADVDATYEVLKAQVERYDEIENDMDFISSKTKMNPNQIDMAGRLAMVNDIPSFNFGKYKGQAVAKVLEKDPGYYNWIMRSDFSLHTKQKLKEIKLTLSF